MRNGKSIIFFALVLQFIIGGCRTNKQLISTPANEKISIESQNTSSMISFLFFEIRHDAINNSNSIKLTEKREVAGKLKNEYEEFHIFSTPCLLINFYEDNDLMHSSKMEHPLFRFVEYPQNDNKLGMEMIQSEIGEFSLRCQLKPSKKQKIVVSEMINKDTINKLITIDL